jgi:hypothetical protein
MAARVIVGNRGGKVLIHNGFKYQCYVILTNLILFKLYFQGLIYWKRGLKIHDIKQSLIALMFGFPTTSIN